MFRPVRILLLSLFSTGIGALLVVQSFHERILAMGISGAMMLIPAAYVAFCMMRYLLRLLGRIL